MNQVTRRIIISAIFGPIMFFFIFLFMSDLPMIPRIIVTALLTLVAGIRVNRD